MTTLFNHRGRFARASALCLLAAAAALFQAREARAQWTQPDPAGNINSTNTGNVGIGTTAPAAVLDAQRSDAADALMRFWNTSQTGGTATFRIANSSNVGSRLQFTDASAFVSTVAADRVGGLRFRTGNATSEATLVDRMSILPTGNVGIGTTAPSRALSIEGPVAPAVGFNAAGVERGTLGVSTLAGNWFTGTAVGDTSLRSQANDLWIGTYASSKPIRFVTNDAQRLIIDGAGNVGINSTAPTAKLHIKSGTANGTNLLHLDTGIFGGTFFSVGGTTNNESTFNVAVYRGGQYFSRIGVTNYGHVYLAPDTAAYGNVGIGTTNPTSKLHVVGDITVTGNINAKYQDVAEWVPSTQKLAAGTVVVLDTTRDNHVLASKGSYDTRVAGVISAQPGLSLGEKGEGKVLVATTGRVKVKVDASRAPIKIGDLIVTSEVEGLAMKSVPVELGGVAIHRPGTLIGKALESLEKGTGEILVLLSLQ